MRAAIAPPRMTSGFDAADRPPQCILNRIGTVFGPQTKFETVFLGSPSSSHALQTRQQFFPEDFHFHPGEMLAETNMSTVAERQLLVWRTLDIERERVPEHGL